jgi:hypothetical protein
MFRREREPIQLKISSSKKAETSQDNIKGRNGGLGRISRGDLEIRVCVRISRVALTEDTIAMISLDTGYFAEVL